jgi:hypothetical protein
MDTKKKKSGWSRLFKKKDKIMGVSSGYSNQGYASYTPPTMQSQPISSQRQSHRFSQPASSDTSFMNLNDSRPSRFSTQTTVPKKKGLLNRLFG